MKAIHLRWPLLIVLCMLIVFLNMFPGERTGISAQWENGRYQFFGGTNPPALILSGVVLLVYTVLSMVKQSEKAKAMPGVFRRWIAFWIDFVFAMIIIAPVVGTVPVIAEWKRTGVFQWNIERTVYANGDGLVMTLSMLLFFPLLVAYFANPLLERKPSIGSCIMGYVIVPDEGESLSLKLALLRSLLGFVSVGGVWFAFFRRDAKHGKFWLDKVFNTHAELLK